ncbi:MAG TPA: M48 family metalloprotease [Pyrinomonadaceae bacterium]|nr:M48 family metalloprotease [Pyrinomonadaceae bacterium]
MTQKSLVRTSLVLVLTLYLAIPAALAQVPVPEKPLTNAQVVEMVKANLSTEVIIAKIQVSRCHFDTNPTVLDELRYRGVPDAVITAMAEAPFGTPRTLTPQTSGTGSKELYGTPQSSDKHAVEPQPKANGAAQETIAGTPPRVRTSESVRLPASSDLAEEITLGFSHGSTLLSQYPALIGTPEDQIAQSVFARLRATVAFNGVPDLPYGVTVIQRSDPNAFAQMGGRVYVTSGLAELMGGDVGLWAAVMGHEIAHNIYRHGYKSYRREVELQRQINYWRYRIAMGDQSANWGLLGAIAAGKLINKKLERNDENEADKLGLLMMVEAGYHPDFAINLFRLLKARTGERSKFAALFSDHPRFITREEHIRKLYPEAISRFRALWPDAATSPGGSPPIIATVTKVSSKQDKSTNSVSLLLSFSIRNAKNVALDAEFVFFHKGVAVRSLAPEFQNEHGSLRAIRRFSPTSDDESGLVEITVPATALGSTERKLKARGCLVQGGQVLQCGKDFDVSFPKK